MNVSIISKHLHITGIVQGVGFRPFVYNLAIKHELCGWVRNTSAGVEIHIEGKEAAIDQFISTLTANPPPLAQLDTFQVASSYPQNYLQFSILQSEPILGAFQPISPDISTCDDCLNEVLDLSDRRYRYPFTNCTNCGPRFTIIQDIPYDRPKTTMKDFQMCPSCAREYDDPTDRRFHAQPIACPDCGPQVWLENGTHGGNALQGDLAIRYAQTLLADGKIVAIKGLGGFHLACDGTNSSAVAELRRRKLRVGKPFALMMPNLDVVQENCYLNDGEADLLQSNARPIVILTHKPNSSISPETSPGQLTSGVMLPYTPLHHLLFTDDEGSNATTSGQHKLPIKVLVMTSGNLSEEPIVTDNEQARQVLSGLADAFLMHDRPIHTRCDDLVVRYLDIKKSPLPIRRSRGYAPLPIPTYQDLPPILGVGAELKNTFCLTNGRYAFVSHHIGDLENFETLESFEKGIDHFERLFRVNAQAIAYDLHPHYLATRYALERAERQGLTCIGIQHHHAHIAACMMENGHPHDDPVIGIAFDGTGYGDDGAIWGGEIFIAKYTNYSRIAHLDYAPLPGGDAAIRKPARVALSYLLKSGIDWSPRIPSVAALSPEEVIALKAQISHGLNTPPTSSIGRLFDAVASICGLRHQVTYEAQAAIEFEALAEPAEKNAYSFGLVPINQPGSSVQWTIDPSPVIKMIVEDVLQNQPVSIISARFHNGLSEIVIRLCEMIARQTEIRTVALSGGVWQNIRLLRQTMEGLENHGFKVLFHSKVPTNDGGISLGQVAIAGYRL